MILSELLFPPHSEGTDASDNAPAPASPITSGTVTLPGALAIQNQSGIDLQVVLGYGSDGPTIFLLHGGADGLPGDFLPPVPWFVGPFAILADGSPQYACRFA